jgi:hypothetical protein
MSVDKAPQKNALDKVNMERLETLKRNKKTLKTKLTRTRLDIVSQLTNDNAIDRVN